MNRCNFFGLSTIALTGFALLSGPASLAQQSGSGMHKYFFRAVLTTEGVKDIQKRSATALKTGVAKFDETVGCKLESWYFDYLENTTYGFADCPNEMAVATLSAASNAAGFARVTWRPVLSAEDADKALARSASTRPPQQQ
jgi:GYD domain